MKLLILGGTGFLGSFLSKKLSDLGHEIIILSRKSKSSDFEKISIVSKLDLNEYFDVVINLAGKNLSIGRWNLAQKKAILESRINSTKSLKDIFLNLKHKPSIFINASAIGYYGHSENIEFTEECNAVKGSFSHELCQKWETEFYNINFGDARKITIRTGVVLEKNHGALAKMIPLFKFNLGSVISPGSQYFSWIHIDDFCEAIIFIIQNKNISGPINLTAPIPVTNRELTKELAEILNKKLIFDTPAFILRILYGEMADELLINGQKVLPKKLLDNGFNFKYSNLNLALKNIFEVKK